MDQQYLTVSDVAELGDFFYGGIATQMEKDTEAREETSTRFARFVTMVATNYSFRWYYAVYSKKTGEPYLFTKTTTTDTITTSLHRQVVHFATKALKKT